MQMFQCPNCERLTGFKRSLGFGTFFMVLLTFGFWLLVIPFYPLRCINCGLKSMDAQNIPWYRPGDTGSKIVVAAIGLFVLVVLVQAILHIGSSSPTFTSVPVGNPARTTTAPKGTVTQSKNTEDHELHLLPNLFGSGAVSDGRTYSVALVSAYQTRIPPATELFVQGTFTGLAGPNTITITDEEETDKTLVCGMSPEEFQDVTSLYRMGSRVQVYGTYVHGSGGISVFRNCRVSDPTANVVRLGTRHLSKARQSGPQDKIAAIRMAAEQGSVEAQSELGMMYHSGQGVTQDYPQAVYWYTKAAEQGDPNAQNSLGFIFYKGQGVVQDYTQAAYWFRKAAEQGDASAQFNLGLSHYLGQGVPQDYTQAYLWFALATSGKVKGMKQENAEKWRDAALSHLTPSELSQTEERVRNWREEHPPNVTSAN
jgi:Sel1 repeat